MKRAMGTTSPRPLRTTLPSRAYTDAAWFAREMDRVFARMWIAAGRADQLDHAGAFLRRELAGASVLIVRGPDGSIRAHHNVCRHRGTRLCTDTAGTFPGSIQCPYHAWT
jgi:glycine betaine catabolism A